MKFMRLISCSYLFLSMTGCAVLTIPASRPDVAIPMHWQAMQTDTTVTLAQASWWPQFNQPELVRLIQVANTQNPDSQAALQRLKQARAALQGVGSAAWPQLSGSGGASGNQSRHDSRMATMHSQQVGATLSYEVDLWGRLSATTLAAREQWRASRYDVAGVQLMLETEVASHYFQLCALTERVGLGEKNYALTQDILARMEKMKMMGAVTELDLTQQRQLVATIGSSLETLKVQLYTTRSALAVLVGATPQDFQVATHRLQALRRPIPDATQPATLLTRRPDILQAEAHLLSAQANVTAARAAFFPQLTLSASGLISGFISGGTTLASTLAAGLTAPLFDGGKRHANLSGATARREEFMAVYRQTVLQALKEGEDALQTLHHNQQREALLGAALHAAQTAYRLSKAQYTVGEIDYLTLLDTQRAWIASQDRDIQGQQDTLVSILTLYKALGGAPTLIPEFLYENR